MKNSNHKINLKKQRFIINLLGEICWGYQLEDFESKIGVKREIAEELLLKWIKLEEKGCDELFLEENEVKILKNALKEVENEIEEWEFQTRIGVSLEEVKNSIIQLGS